MKSEQLEFQENKEKSMGSAGFPQISDYMDYRKFLADFYAFRRKQTEGDLRPYSYQNFSAAADIKSPNYLKMIIEGKRNLSMEMVGKFCKAMGLDKDQAAQFRLLVLINQAEDTTERNRYLKELSDLRVDQKIRSGEIDRKTWDKIPNWVAWVIYAMVDQEGVDFDIQRLKQLLRNKASEVEIEIALKSLLDSGELIRDEKTGALVKTRHLMESAQEVPPQLVRKLQAQLMYLGLESLFQDPPTEREFGTLTLCLTKEEFEEVKFKLRQMRKTLHKDNAIARSQSKGERVYQLNIQLFPVTDSTLGEARAMAPRSLKDLFRMPSSEMAEKSGTGVKELSEGASRSAQS